MSSTVIDIADAVTASLNGSTFSPSFTAVRKYVPVSDYADMEKLQVTVVPRTVDITRADRLKDYFETTVDIGIQQRVEADDTVRVDMLMLLVEAIIDFLRSKALTSPVASWRRITNDPVYAFTELDENQHFTSIVTVVYLVRR